MAGKYRRTHDVCVCLYIAYIACGSALLYIKTLYFFLTVVALSAAATVANIKTRYDHGLSQYLETGCPNRDFIDFCVSKVWYQIHTINKINPIYLKILLFYASNCFVCLIKVTLQLLHLLSFKKSHHQQILTKKFGCPNCQKTVFWVSK